MPPSDDGSTVLASLFRSTFDGLRKLGVDVADALDRARIEPASIERPDARLPAPLLVEFWRVVTERTHPDIGLQLAEAVEPGALDALDFAMRSAPTIGDALHRFCRYHRIVCTGTSFELELRRGGGTLRHRAPAFIPLPRALRDVAITSFVVAGRQATGRPWLPVEARFAYAKPARTAEHRRILGPNVQFDCAYDELVLSEEVLALPQHGADARLADVLERHLAAAVGALPKPQSFEDRVRHAVAATLADEAPSLRRIARALGVSARTLTRRLAEEGTKFSAVVDAIRAEMASSLLHQRNLGVSEVSYLLGFSEPSAFTRAFQRWTGTSPTEFRRAATTSPTE